MNEHDRTEVTVRTPIWWPSIDWMSNVNKTALAQCRAFLTNSRIDRTAQPRQAKQRPL